MASILGSLFTPLYRPAGTLCFSLSISLSILELFPVVRERVTLPYARVKKLRAQYHTKPTAFTDTTVPALFPTQDSTLHFEPFATPLQPPEMELRPLPLQLQGVGRRRTFLKGSVPPFCFSGYINRPCGRRHLLPNRSITISQ